MIIRTLASTVLLALACIPNANASIVTYASRAAFNTANPTATTEGFEGITTPTSNGIGNVSYGTTFSRGALTITDGGVSGAALNVLDNTYVNGGNQIRNRFGVAAGSVLDAAYGDITLTFGGGITAFGIDLATIARGFVGSSSATFGFLVDGVSIGSYNYSGSSGFGFFGFTDSVAFTTLKITNTARVYDDVFDNVSFVAAPAAVAVPEPDSIALFGLGVMAIAVARRRKAA